MRVEAQSYYEMLRIRRKTLRASRAGPIIQGMRAIESEARMQPETLYCRPCDSEKPAEDFCRDNSRPSRGYRATKCRACSSLAKRQTLYGIKPAEYRAMYEAQGGRCAICRDDSPLAVDHCHTTGEVRGLLCALCNRALGLMRDNPENLSAAISYLKAADRAV